MKPPIDPQRCKYEELSRQFVKLLVPDWNTGLLTCLCHLLLAKYNEFSWNEHRSELFYETARALAYEKLNLPEWERRTREVAARLQAVQGINQAKPSAIAGTRALEVLLAINETALATSKFLDPGVQEPNALHSLIAKNVHQLVALTKCD